DGSGFTNLHNFTAANNLTNADGINPVGTVFSSGNILYGTAAGGGVSSNGTVFAVNTDGSNFKVLHAFGPTLNLTNGDGATPVSVLLSSNTLYGVAHAGGAGASGAVFSLFVPPPLNLGFAGGSAVLAWPTNADGFTLQSSSNLFSPIGWRPVIPAPVPVNGQNVVTDSFSGGQMFYRLTR
ncbi:MAG TPA: choice-of-anchor tandem repeat GloVer-containing protein, partial [Verrucomicrobiae bacterium]